MKVTSKILLPIVALALFGLACGLGGAVTDKVEEAKATAIQSAEQASEQVQEAAKEVEKAAGEAQQAVEQAKPTEAVGEAPAAEDGVEEATVEADNINSALNNFSAYRTKIKMVFKGLDSEGKPADGTIEIFSEKVKEPPASHMSMKMQGTTLGNVDMQGAENFEIETYVVNDMVYMRNPLLGQENPWVSYAATGEEDFSSGFSAGDLVDMPSTARRSLLPQDVNGISCWHYTFNEKDIPADERMVFQKATGEVWVAREGKYPVKFTVQATTAAKPDAKPAEGKFFVAGDFSVEYELMDVNQSIEIVVPEEATKAGASMGGGANSGSGEAAFPMVDDAKVDFSMEGMLSYTSQKSVKEVVEFYREQLPPLGWKPDTTLEMVDETGALLSFKQEAKTLTISISVEEGTGLKVALITGQ